MALAAVLAAGTCTLAVLLARLPAGRLRPPGGWSRGLAWLPTPWRLAGRALGRRPSGTAAQTLLLASAMALPVAFGCFSDSWQTWARQSFDRETWDAWITLRAPVEPAAFVVPGARILPVLQGSADLHVRGREVFQARLWGVPEGTRGARRGGVVLPERVARAHGVSVGAPVSLTHAGRRLDLMVTALARDLAFETVYLEAEDAARLLGSARFQAALVEVGAAPGGVLERLRRHELVTTLTTRAALAERVAEYLRDVGKMADLAVPLAVLLAALLVGAAVRSAQAARAAELGWLRMLGFPRFEIRATLALELALKLCLALVLMVPLSLGAALLLDRALAQVFFPVPLVVRPLRAAAAVGPVLAAALLSAAIALRGRGAVLARALAPALALLVLAAAPDRAAAQPADAGALVARARQALAFGGAGLRAVIKLEARRGDRLLLRRVEVLAAADGSAVRVTVLDPPDLRGTIILTQRDGTSVKRAIYVPALRRVRPLGAGRGLEPFLGTDLLFGDLEVLDEALYRFRLDGEIDEGGRRLARLLGTPASKEAAFTAVELLVDRASGVPRRIRVREPRGGHDIEILKTERDQGQPRVREARVGATTVIVEALRSESPDRSAFSAATLEGR
jgi:hypothetical protein